MIGYNFVEKKNIINSYIDDRPFIKKVYIIYYKHFEYDYDINIEHEYIEYSDTIEYEYFYRLIADIVDDCLIIIDEGMRTSNRNDLTYNCIHHFTNQTKHKLIFEYFPIISKEKDFMILLNYFDKAKYKGKSFSWELLDDINVFIKDNEIDYEVINVEITDKQREKYTNKAHRLFNELGRKKDPDTIPRDLQLYAGNMKKKMIKENNIYLARNKRFRLDNVLSYYDLKHAEINSKDIDIVIDFHYRQINFNDYLKKFDVNNVKYLSTGLSIDTYHVDKFRKFLHIIKRFREELS